jgi:hypothetical protein
MQSRQQRLHDSAFWHIRRDNRRQLSGVAWRRRLPKELLAKPDQSHG